MNFHWLSRRKRVAELMGCVACHSTDGSMLGKVGPTWKGLFGSEVALAGGHITEDEAEVLFGLHAHAAYARRRRTETA